MQHPTTSMQQPPQYPTAWQRSNSRRNKPGLVTTTTLSNMTTTKLIMHEPAAVDDDHHAKPPAVGHLLQAAAKAPPMACLLHKDTTFSPISCTQTMPSAARSNQGAAHLDSRCLSQQQPTRHTCCATIWHHKQIDACWWKSPPEPSPHPHMIRSAIGCNHG